MNHSTTTIDELLGSLDDVEKKNAPSGLYYSGNLDLLLNYSCVSIIGTRKASIEGRKRASYLTKKLVEKDVTIISGLAEGIDTIAHKTAIDNGGKTVAVLGNPIDEFYPKSNKDLQEILMKDHLVISQFAPNTPIQKKNFPMRNRTMALFSNATVIVDMSSDKSGTVHQGWEALRLGRALYIMESVVNNRSLRVPDELIKYGAKILSKQEDNNTLESLFQLLPEGGRTALAELTF